MPGYSTNIDATVSDSDSRLIKVAKEGYVFGKTQNKDNLNKSKFRRFRGRVLVVTTCILLAIPLLAALQNPTILGLLGGGVAFLASFLGIANFWWDHLEKLQMKEIQTLNVVTDERDKQLDALLDPTGEYKKEINTLPWNKGRLSGGT